jgi:hypothetical protein
VGSGKESEGGLMGDIGEYWRDHKEYQRRRKGAEQLGMSMREYANWERQCESERNQANRADKIERCAIQCECGKWLLDTAAHNSHKMVKGRKGHSVKATKEAKLPKEISWAI